MPVRQPPHTDVVVVGAGFAGVALTRELLRRGIDDFVVLEQADAIGGTWRDNTYPGCRCDIESALYSFSFAPNPDWTDVFASQPEILAYLRAVAEQVGLPSRVQLACRMERAEWDPQRRLWRLHTSRGPRTCRVLVTATGPFNEPNWLELPGRDGYRGQVVHTARWPNGLDLAGRDVVVVGTGASAVQVVPAIQPMVRLLTVAMRTPPWVTPRTNSPVPTEQRRRWREHPDQLRRHRRSLYWAHEAIGFAFARHPALARVGERAARRHLRDQVPDPGLRALLTPRYRLGCKRVTPSDDFYPALNRPNVSLVPLPATSFTAAGIRTADGAEHIADVVVMATGFRVAAPEATRAVVGADGRSLYDTCAGSPRGYLGTTVHGFPNLFTVPGPATGQGHTSVLLYHEAQATYIGSALTWMRQRGVKAVEVDAGAQDRFNGELQRQLRRSVWVTGGCASWYQDATGLVSLVWPWSTREFVRRTSGFDPSVYRLMPG